MRVTLCAIVVVVSIFPVRGGRAESALAFRAPTGVAVGPNGDIYIADQTSDRVVRLASTGAALTMWGGAGKRNGEFDRPSALVLDSHAHVFVADAGNSRIEEFTASGRFLRSWKTPRYFDHVAAANRIVPSELGIRLGIDREDRIYAFVPIQKKRRRLELWKYAESGKLISHVNIGARYALVPDASVPLAPLSLAVDGRFMFVALWTSGGSPSGYYAEGSVLEKRSLTGALLFQWGGVNSVHPSGKGALLPDSSGVICKPDAMALSGRNLLWLTDTCNHRVEEVSPSGHLIRHFGVAGCGAGKFGYPSSIAVDSHGAVYVTDRDGGTVQKFSAKGKPLALWGSCSG